MFLCPVKGFILTEKYSLKHCLVTKGIVNTPRSYSKHVATKSSVNTWEFFFQVTGKCQINCAAPLVIRDYFPLSSLMAMTKGIAFPCGPVLAGTAGGAHHSILPSSSHYVSRATPAGQKQQGLADLS